MADLHVVILRGGQGMRDEIRAAQVLHRVAGLPMIEHVLAARRPRLAPRSTTLVVGHQAEAVLCGASTHRA